ncbi:MAG: response regulator transcription factor [Ramlibacter sp.]|nr:response regulator transcription factor [Ramlibacter sp.]
MAAYILLLEDHPLVVQGLSHYLASARPELPVRVAASWQAGEELIHVHGSPALVLADVWLVDGNSLDALRRCQALCPQTPWLAYSGDDEPALRQRVRDAGAQGFVHKQAPVEEFARALNALLGGAAWHAADTQVPLPGGPRPREWTVTPAELGLTPRQGEILALVLRGLPNKRIAHALTVSESTVKEHVTGILSRLGVRTRVEAIALLQGRRLAHPGAA